MEIFENCKKILLQVVRGVKDSYCSMYNTYFSINAQEAMRENVQRMPPHIQNSSLNRKIIQCLIFGLFYWLSNYCFKVVILNSCIPLLVNWLSLENVWLQKLISSLFFNFCWILPMFCMSKLLTFIWYQDIADIIFVNANIKRTNEHGFGVNVADQIESFLVQTVYCAQGYIMYFLPIPILLQNIVYFCHLSILSSLYAFEYKWVHTGMLLNRRLSTVDRRWPYFLGFGMTLASITICFDSFIDSMIVFSTLFPIYIIGSSNIITEEIPLAAFPLHTFKISFFVSNVIIGFILRLLPARYSTFRR